MVPSLHYQCPGSVPSWAPELPRCPAWLGALLPGDLDLAPQGPGLPSGTARPLACHHDACPVLRCV